MLSVVCNYWLGFPMSFVKLNETVKLNLKKMRTRSMIEEEFCKLQLSMLLYQF